MVLIGLRSREQNQLPQPLVQGGFRHRRPAFLGQVAERQRRMAQTQVGSLAQVRRQPLEPPVTLEPADRLNLPMRGSRGANEVRVIRVRQSVRSRTSGAENRAFLEQEDSGVGAGARQNVGDHVRALRIRQRVSAAVEDAEAESLARRESDEEARALDSGCADLEVRSARAAERAAAEQRSA